MAKLIEPVLWLAFAVAIAAIPFTLGPFAVTLFNYIGIYTLVALGLVLMTGCGGLTSFGQAAFVGLGAYATAYLTTAHGLSPWIGLLAAVAIGALVALVVGGITLHLGGHYLPMTTIAWGLAIYLAFGNFDFLGRHGGISQIPAVEVYGIRLERMPQIYYLIWGFVGIAIFLSINLLNSRQGRAIRSLRGGKILAESLGIDMFRVRLVVFVIAAVLAAVAGWLFAHMQRFVSPAPFDLKAGIEYLLMAVLGGSGHIAGAVIGAALVALTKNWLQDLLPLVTKNSGNFEIVVFGVLFILLLQNARQGLVPLLLRWLPLSGDGRATTEPVPEMASTMLPRQALPQRMTPLLRVDGLSKSFGGLKAVNNVTMAVLTGEILALIGPNGAGKSTTFNLIAGVLPPTSGTVTFAGEDITGETSLDIASLRLARTFQHVKLRPAMSVLDNTMLGAYGRTRAGFLRGALRLDRREEALARNSAWRALADAGLADKAHMLAGNLSLGQQRLVEIARALASDPVLLMLDEPAAGLRALEKKALADLLRKLREQGLTILLVEHDMDFVMGLADQIVVLDFGQKLAEGLPSEIRAHRAVQEAYLGGVI